MTTTRQETRRAATRREIMDTARVQMAEHGAAALSLRAIARQMQMTAPALYRYFRNRDALVTALILEAFESLAQSMAAARDARPAGRLADRLLAMCLAYREWAQGHPHDYLLIFGTPIPGYEAPAEITSPAARRLFEVFFEALNMAGPGRQPQVMPAVVRPSPALRAQVQTWRKKYGYTAADPAMLYSLVAWTRMHGLVSLEIVGQIQPFFGDAGELYRMEMIRLLEDAGLHPSLKR